MIRDVLRSIKPYWLYLILIGKETIEVGKTEPLADDWTGKVFLYCTKDLRSFKRIPEKDREWMRKYLGKVACCFICDTVYTIKWVRDFERGHWYWEFSYDSEADCLSDTEFQKYFGDKEFGYGWHIDKLEKFEEPRELNTFIQFRTPKQIESDVAIAVLTGLDNNPYLKRPPQSWCYVEAPWVLNFAFV
ncbi:MAG: hypothetical protein J6D20_07440 [Clostridia bacterium]|nr:hypothetical protein [Clostridia bacterium]